MLIRLATSPAVNPRKQGATMAVKQRQHNEWFRPVSLGNRKTCPTCKAKLATIQGIGNVWSWGEYHNAKWRTVAYFCRQCFASEVAARLASHTGDCGCTINLVGKGCELPNWLTLRLPGIVASESRHSLVGAEGGCNAEA
jgi:hypothetical protein